MEVVKIPIELLEVLSPSQYNLLSMVADLMNEKMLWEIARADYGYEADNCFTELAKIKNTKKTPTEIDFTLQEALNLTRWIKPTSKEEHIIRLFSCTNLIILYPVLKVHVDNENETLAAFIESILYLGDNYYRSSLQLISWRILYDYQEEIKYLKEGNENEEDAYIDPVYQYVLLLLMILNKQPEEKIKIVQNWLLNPESENSYNQTEKVDILIETIESGLRSERVKSIKPHLPIFYSWLIWQPRPQPFGPIVRLKNRDWP